MKISKRFAAPAIALAAVASISAAGGATAAVLINGNNIIVHTVPENRLTSAAITALVTAHSITGVQIVTAQSSTPGSVGIKATCPTGKRAIGGGGSVNVNGTFFEGAYPSTDGLGWWAEGNNGSTGVTTAYVVCAKIHN